jgi:hypothetical protein
MRWLALSLLLAAPALPGVAAAQDRPELRSEGPSVGQPAPDFTLKKLDSEETLTLSQVVEKNQPVVLVFGSYT